MKDAALLGVALLTGTMDGDVWIADSGAIYHMTKSHKFFTLYTVFGPETFSLVHKLMVQN